MKSTRNSEIASRLTEIRKLWCGEQGAQFFADALRLPLRAWLNYESGITVPGDVMLKFLVLTHANPKWLLSGKGAKCARLTWHR